MSNKHQQSWTPTLVAIVASSLAPQSAFASVGAGAGLPFEDVFSKFITSVTGPWAWAVSILCVCVFVWKGIERGGDLGGSTLGFLGPAFLCALLLGVKKVMSFMGQGAMLQELNPALWATFAGGVAAGALSLGWLVTLPLYRSYKRLHVRAMPEHALET